MRNGSRRGEGVSTGRERLRILVVDDHAGTQRSIQLILGWLGCSSDLAVDGREAWEAARAREYDLILMDVDMPRMDGLEATRRIRGDQGLAAGPRIVGISADAAPEDREIGLRAGMDDFLGKPIRVEALAHILDAVVLDLAVVS